MLRHWLRGTLAASMSLGMATVVACSSSSNSGTPDGGAGGGGGGAAGGGGGGIQDAGPASCTAPGEPTPGPADTHCTDTDGGAIVQPTDPGSCYPDAATPDAGGQCPYQSTKYGHVGDDDDCKYHVTWSSTAICEGAAGVTFTVVATNRTDNSPLTGANTIAETFTTSPGDASCDDVSTHPGPNTGVELTEGPPGTYTGTIIFDTPGQWTVRFHFHEECADVLPTSPHGHAAYHITVP